MFKQEKYVDLTISFKYDVKYSFIQRKKPLLMGNRLSEEKESDMFIPFFILMFGKGGKGKDGLPDEEFNFSDFSSSVE